MTDTNLIPYNQIGGIFGSAIQSTGNSNASDIGGGVVKGIGSGLGTAAGIGAAIGTPLGPVGIAIGAGIGAIVGGISGFVKHRNEERIDQAKVSSEMLSRAQSKPLIYSPTTYEGEKFGIYSQSLGLSNTQ